MGLEFIKEFKEFVGDNSFCIYGAGFLGRFLVSSTDIGKMDVKCFIDDKQRGEYKNIPILGKEALKDIEYVLVAISYPRNEIIDELRNLNKKVFIIDGTVFTLLREDITPDIDLDEDYAFKILKRNQNIKNILLIKLDYFGDTMASLKSLYYLRYKYPNANIDAILTEESAFVLAGKGIFDNIFISKEYSRNPSSKALYINQMPLKEYDMAIDVGFGPDTRFLLNNIKSKIKAGLYSADVNLDISVPILKPNVHINDLIEELIDKLPTYIKSQKQSISKIAMFPAASTPHKEWIEEEFINFLGLLEKDKDIELINLYFDSENTLRRFNIPPYSKIRYNISLDFKSLKTHLQTNDIFIGVDSFGSHISSYAGLPCILIFFDFSTIEFTPLYTDVYIVFRKNPYPRKRPFVKASTVYSILKKCGIILT